MKRILSVLMIVFTIFSLSACRKRSDSPCERCHFEKAYLYEIEKIGKIKFEETKAVSYCEKCFDIYLEETFGYGLKEKAQEEDAHFKDVVGSGGYLDELQK